MGTRTRIRIEFAMIQTKFKPKFVNIRIQFKILILKIRNPNILGEFEQIYECPLPEKDIQQIS